MGTTKPWDAAADRPHDAKDPFEEFSAEVLSEADVREARAMVSECENVERCFSATAAFAGLVKPVRQGDRHQSAWPKAA